MINIPILIIFTFVWFMVFFFYGLYGDGVNQGLNTVIGNLNSNLFCNIDPVIITLIGVFIFVLVIKGFIKFGQKNM